MVPKPVIDPRAALDKGPAAAVPMLTAEQAATLRNYPAADRLLMILRGLVTELQGSRECCRRAPSVPGNASTLPWVDRFTGALIQAELALCVAEGRIEPGTEPLTDAELAAKIATMWQPGTQPTSRVYLERAAARLRELSSNIPRCPGHTAFAKCELPAGHQELCHLGTPWDHRDHGSP